jgi:hypothetical protein
MGNGKETSVSRGERRVVSGRNEASRLAMARSL